jgi:tetratricopeptide (TPR) repeat protein
MKTCTILGGLFSSIWLAAGFPAAAQSGQASAAIEPAKPAVAQTLTSLSLQLAPSIELPISDSGQYFGLGGSLGVELTYNFPRTIFGLTGGLGYFYSSTKAIATLSTVSARLGGGVEVPLGPLLTFLGFGYCGCYFTTTNDFSVSAFDPLAGFMAGLQFSLGPVFSINATAGYENYFGLWQGVSAGIGTRIALEALLNGLSEVQPGRKQPAVQPAPAPNKLPPVQRVELLADFPPAFSIFYKHYDDHPIGTLKVTNHLGSPISNIKVQFYIKHYMDEPKTVESSETLLPEATKEIDVFALFTDEVLNITEGTKVAAELVTSYEAKGKTCEEKKILTVNFFGRNAMTWDDNRKAAAFVAAKDPSVLQFARGVTSQVRGMEKRSINENVQAAIALHEALDLYGLDYVPNPVTPYSEASKKNDVVDFLQFPRETLRYKAGDCSDISILYCALLQAVGIGTAFITIPGHIFVAVNTGISPEEAATALMPENEYLTHDGKVWLPVEITLRHQGFLRAWELGAKEWNENKGIGQAGFYPVLEAWKVYQPVGLPGTSEPVPTPATDLVLAAYKVEAQRYLDATIGPEVVRLETEIRIAGSSKEEDQGTAVFVALNKLGILQAKSGSLEKAEATFKQILAMKTYLPALLNLGNLCFMRNDCKAALDCYQQASKLAPSNPHVLLAIAKACRDLKDYAGSKKAYDELKALDPKLAGQFPSLGAGTEKGSRASDIETSRRMVLWEGD